MDKAKISKADETKYTIKIRDMKKQELFTLFDIEDIQDLSRAVLPIVLGDIDKRNEIYQSLLQLNNYNMSFDWFQKIYEDENAQRKENKQDFTPYSASLICSMLTGTPKGKVYEPTSGNGGMIIVDWWNRCKNSDFPLMHFPSDNKIECWELSQRSIPLLLLNLSIRGIMGTVYHGDVLEQAIKAKYILLNRNNDTLAFSEIIHDKNLNLKIEEI